jgi:hypothetical protein
MKKMFFILALSPLPLLAQIGVGIFNINQTKIEIIDSITSITELNKRVSFENNRSIERYNKGVNSTRGIIELRKDTSNYEKSDPRAFTDTSINVFYINYFKIGQFPVYNIYLTFYKGILVGFSCEQTKEFLDAFTSKYSAPETKTEEKIIYCQNGFGATTTNKEIKLYYNWTKLNKTIWANALSSVTYNDKCEPYFFNNFTLKDEVKFKILEGLEEKYRNIIEQKAKQIQSDKLKGF